MSIYYVLGRKLGTGDIAENKESESLPSPGLTFQQRESAIGNQYIKINCKLNLIPQGT